MIARVFLYHQFYLTFVYLISCLGVGLASFDLYHESAPAILKQASHEAVGTHAGNLSLDQNNNVIDKK